MLAEEAQARLNILFVEDNEDDVEIVRRILARSRVDTRLHVVKDGAEAMELLLSRYTGEEAPAGEAPRRPDLILLDLSLPKVGGLEILRRMKADPELCSVPVVVLTGSIAEEPIRQCMELGSNMCLLKPMDIADAANIVSGIQKYWGRLDELDQKAA